MAISQTEKTNNWAISFQLDFLKKTNNAAINTSEKYMVYRATKNCVMNVTGMYKAEKIKVIIIELKSMEAFLWLLIDKPLSFLSIIFFKNRMGDVKSSYFLGNHICNNNNFNSLVIISNRCNTCF